MLPSSFGDCISLVGNARKAIVNRSKSQPSFWKIYCKAWIAKSSVSSNKCRLNFRAQMLCKIFWWIYLCTYPNYVFSEYENVFSQFVNSSSFATIIRLNTFFQTALRKKVDFKFLWSKNKHFFTKIDWLESKTLQKFCCKVFNPTTRVPFYGRMKFTLFHRRRNRTRSNSKKMHSLSILFLFKRYFHSFYCNSIHW